MSDQSAEDPLEPELRPRPAAATQRARRDAAPDDEEYELAVERDRVAAGLADYVPAGSPAGDRPVRAGRSSRSQLAYRPHRREAMSELLRH